MLNLRSKVENLCVYGIGFFCIGVISLIFFYNMQMTSYLVKWEVTYFVEDSIIKNFLVLGSFLLVLFIANKTHILCKLNCFFRNDKCYKMIKYGLLWLILGLALIWAVSTQYIPGIDEGLIQTYIYRFIRGDASMFAPGEYMNKYPFQWFYFIYAYVISCIFGSKNYIVFEIINAVAICMIYKQFAEIVGLYTENRLCQISVLIIGVLFFPLIGYSIIIYGNIVGMALAYTAVKHEMLYFKDYNWKNAFLSSIAISIAVAIKNNMTIHFIAMIIFAIVKLINKRRKKNAFIICLFLLSCTAQSLITEKAIEVISGYNMENPCSSWAYITMGLKESPLAPGWWNEYVETSYEESGRDTKIQERIAKKELKKILKRFKNQPEYTFDFFSKKIASIWANPSFQCFGTVREGSNIEVPKWVYCLLSYPGQYRAMILYHIMTILILFGAIVALILSFNNRELFINTFIFPLIIVGGFLFHLIWEAKARYTIYYFVALIPYACIGYKLLLQGKRHDIIAIGEKRHTKKNLGVSTKIMLCVAAIFLMFWEGLYSNERRDTITQDTTDYYEYLNDQTLIENILPNDSYLVSSPKGMISVTTDKDGSSIVGLTTGNAYPIEVITYAGESYLCIADSKAFLMSTAEVNNGKRNIIISGDGKSEYSRWSINAINNQLFSINQGEEAITYDIKTGELYLRTYTGSFNQQWRFSNIQTWAEAYDDWLCLSTGESKETADITDNLHGISDIEEYLKCLNKYKNSLDILISVKDIQGYALNQNIIDEIERLGISNADVLLEHQYHSFLALIHQGNVCVDKMGGDERIVSKYNLENDRELKLESATLNAGNSSEIVIDGIDYAIKGRGFNFVITDCNTGAIMDCVTFDTHVNDIPCMR